VTEKKLTRGEKKARKELSKAFDASFKIEAKQAGWGYIKPTAFKRIGDWFVCLNPSISTEAERAQLMGTVKPFAIDDLMSKILGFGGLEGTPLSLRARGPYSLVVPMFTTSIEAGGRVDAMVGLASDFMREIEPRAGQLTYEDFITFVDDRPSGTVGDNQVAARILAGRKEEALSLCESAIASKQHGSNARVTEDGQIVSFFELARHWIRNS
jgi:hypothetical protein